MSLSDRLPDYLLKPDDELTPLERWLRKWCWSWVFEGPPAGFPADASDEQIGKWIVEGKLTPEMWMAHAIPRSKQVQRLAGL